MDKETAVRLLREHMTTEPKKDGNYAIVHITLTETNTNEIADFIEQQEQLIIILCKKLLLIS